MNHSNLCTPQDHLLSRRQWLGGAAGAAAAAVGLGPLVRPAVADEVKKKHKQVLSIWLGAGPSGLPPYVWVKPMNGGFVFKDAGFLGPKYGALAFGDGKPPENLLRHPSLTELDDIARNDLRKKIEGRYAARRRKGTTEA